jgi:hypothetical protein
MRLCRIWSRNAENLTVLFSVIKSHFFSWKSRFSAFGCLFSRIVLSQSKLCRFFADCPKKELLSRFCQFFLRQSVWPLIHKWPAGLRGDKSWIKLFDNFLTFWHFFDIFLTTFWQFVDNFLTTFDTFWLVIEYFLTDQRGHRQVRLGRKRLPVPQGGNMSSVAQGTRGSSYLERAPNVRTSSEYYSRSRNARWYALTPRKEVDKFHSAVGQDSNCVRRFRFKICFFWRRWFAWFWVRGWVISHTVSMVIFAERIDRYQPNVGKLQAVNNVLTSNRVLDNRHYKRQPFSH